MDLGQETPVTMPDGSIKILSRLEGAVIFGFRDYVLQQEGDPIKELKEYEGMIPYMEKADVAQLIKDAKAKKKELSQFSFGSDLAQKHIATETGAIEFLRLLLLLHHPKATTSDAYAVLMALIAKEGVEAVANLMRRAMGVSEGNGHAPEKSLSGAAQKSLAGVEFSDASCTEK
jgi:hypothetical protein